MKLVVENLHSVKCEPFAVLAFGAYMQVLFCCKHLSYFGNTINWRNYPISQMNKKYTRCKVFPRIVRWQQARRKPLVGKKHTTFAHSSVGTCEDNQNFNLLRGTHAIETTPTAVKQISMKWHAHAKFLTSML